MFEKDKNVPNVYIPIFKRVSVNEYNEYNRKFHDIVYERNQSKYELFKLNRNKTNKNKEEAEDDDDDESSDQPNYDIIYERIVKMKPNIE